MKNLTKRTDPLCPSAPGEPLSAISAHSRPGHCDVHTCRQFQIQKASHKSPQARCSSFDMFVPSLNLTLVLGIDTMPHSHHSHSGQFCKHAAGTLEEVVLQAIQQGFETFGLTEHVPRYRTEDLYPEEVCGLLSRVLPMSSAKLINYATLGRDAVRVIDFAVRWLPQ